MCYRTKKYIRGENLVGKLWFNGKIYTMISEKEIIEAIYTEEGLIKAVGSEEMLRKQFAGEINEEINLDGGVMYPGFVDSHLHIIGHGEKLMRLNLSHMTSANEVKEALRHRLDGLETDEWVYGEGWNENQWEDPSIIHRRELDEICSDHPMVLTRICRHAILANSKAMELANVSTETENPQGGVIVRDEFNEPTGYFLDTAQDLIKSAMPSVSELYLQKAVKLAVDDLLRYGLVGGHSEDLNYYGGFNKTYRAFHASIDGEERKFRANLLVHHEVVKDMHDEGHHFKAGTEFVELGAMKIFADGALGGRTALLTKGYSDDEGNFGVAIHSSEGLERLFVEARRRGMPIAVHAIGDGAVVEVLNMIEKHPPKEGLRDRIIHAQILREELLDRLARNDVIVDIQPTFVSSDFPWVQERIGNDRDNIAYAWKTLIDKGVLCAGGSDAPIEEVNPLLGIQAAVTRRSSLDENVYNESEKLTPYEAISLYTKGSAMAISEEKTRGVIAPGFIADFTVLEDDLFEVNPEEISKVKVAMTVIDETIAYKK